MIRTQVQLREEQMDALRERASESRVSIAELIRQAVDMLLESSGTIDDAERRRRAIAAAGRFRSDVADVSANHDRYLVQAYEEDER
jgi:hypothetical protein